MGEYLDEVGPEYKAYLFGMPRIYYGTHKSVDFLRGNDAPVTDIREPLTGEPTFVDPNSKAVFIFIPEREGELQLVQQYMPGGEVFRKYDCGELMMITYRVDGSSLR